MNFPPFKKYTAYAPVRTVFTDGKNLPAKRYVTLGWDCHPITTKGDGYILPRAAEMIINDQYYPNGKVGEWPCDPVTGEKLEIEPRL